MRSCAQSPRYNDGSKSQKYICFARKQSRYMLGDKTGASYVVGYGPNYPQRPADRGASCPAPPQNCTTVNGLYNPAPNPHVLTGALVMVRKMLSSDHVWTDVVQLHAPSGYCCSAQGCWPHTACSFRQRVQLGHGMGDLQLPH